MKPKHRIILATGLSLSAILFSALVLSLSSCVSGTRSLPQGRPEYRGLEGNASWNGVHVLRLSRPDRTGSTKIVPGISVANLAATGERTMGGLRRLPFTLIQSSAPTVPNSPAPVDEKQVDATSSPTSSGAQAEGADAISSATEIAAGLEAPESCLVCHGPFEKLAAGTAAYITEWDELANPHVHVPHDSETIVTCTDCHEEHAIPLNDASSIARATVQYCYSCHHAETLAHCNTCHKE